MTILPLKGYKSFCALNAFNMLLLGLNRLPAYQSMAYEEFFLGFGEISDAKKESLLREASLFVTLTEDEIQSLACFAADKNGIPYSQGNLKNLGPAEIHEIIVAVCMEIGRIKIEILSEEEKKNFPRSALKLEKVS